MCQILKKTKITRKEIIVKGKGKESACNVKEHLKLSERENYDFSNSSKHNIQIETY